MSSPLNELRHIRSKIKFYLEYLLNREIWAAPEEWEILAGVSYRRNQAAAPIAFKDEARAKQLNITTQCITIFDANKIRIQKDDAIGEYLINVPQTFEEIERNYATNKFKKLIAYDRHFYDVKQKADLIWDTKEELTACDFPYTAVATTLTQKTREEIYQRPLPYIKMPVNSGQGTFNLQVSPFHNIAAQTATYKVNDPVRSYYPKWKNPGSSKPEEKTYILDNLSDEYLKENFRYYELQKDHVYFYLQISSGEKIIYTLFKAYLDIDKFIRDPKNPSLRMEIDRLISRGLPKYGDPFSIFKNEIEILRGEKAKFKCTAQVFFVIDGAEEMPDYFIKEEIIVSPGIKINHLEEILDPQFMYQQYIKKGFYERDEDQKDWTHIDWLKALVKLRFSEHWVWFEGNNVLNMFLQPDRDKLFLKDLKAEIDSAKDGPLKAKLLSKYNEIKNEESQYLVRRGMDYTPYQRIIGSDDGYIFLYSNREKILSRIPMYIFWMNINLMQLSNEIYQKTKGIIPAFKIFAWGTAIGFGAAAYGPVVLASHGFRVYIGEKIKGYAENVLINLAGGYKMIMRRIVVYAVHTLISLLPHRKGHPYYEGGRAFVNGFINGYTHDSIISLFQNFSSFASLEPRSYKTIKIILKIKAALNLLDEKISYIKPYLGDEASEKLMHNFLDGFEEALSGITCLINNLYFLEYKQVKIFLDIYVEITGSNLISEKEWEGLRFKHFIEIFSAYNKELTIAQKSVMEIYSDIKSNIDGLKRAVKIAESAMIVEAVTGGALIALVLYALCKTKDFALFAGKQLGTYVIPGVAVVGIVRMSVEEKFRADVFAVIGDIGGILKSGFNFIFGKTFSEERMERLGTLTGQVFGGITLSKKVFGDKSWAETWKGSSKKSNALAALILKNELKVSPVLPVLKIIFFNYITIVEKVIESSKKEWESLQKEIAEILADENFSDIIEDTQIFSIEKLLRLISAIDKRLTAWLTELSKIPGITDEISRTAELIKGVKPDQFPSFKDLIDGTNIEDWSREAILFIILSQLHCSLLMIVNAIQKLNDSVVENKNFGILHLLSILGYQFDERELTEVLERHFTAVFEDA